VGAVEEAATAMVASCLALRVIVLMVLLCSSAAVPGDEVRLSQSPMARQAFLFRG